MDLEGINILSIEDSPGDFQMVREYLKNTNLPITKVLHAITLKEGFELLEREHVDIILLDLHLPDSYGIDTFYKIFHQSVEVPIIVLSGFGDVMMALEIVRNGAIDYLEKSNMNERVLERSILYCLA